MGLEVPDDFAAEPYDLVNRMLAGREYVRLVDNTLEDHIWEHYTGAWNALAFPWPWATSSRQPLCRYES
jgi:hypothetical protein